MLEKQQIEKNEMKGEERYDNGITKDGQQLQIKLFIYFYGLFNDASAAQAAASDVKMINDWKWHESKCSPVSN